MRVYLESGEHQYIYEVTKASNGTYIFQNEAGKTKEFFIRKLGDQHYYSQDKVKWNKIVPFKSQKHLNILNEDFKCYFGFKPSGANAADEGSLMAQMPGKVIKVMAEVGAEVKKGDPVIILEAMKMENELKAPKDGVIEQIHITEGQAVDAGESLISLK
jgi:biotin carboxyl carrier protein